MISSEQIDPTPDLSVCVLSYNGREVLERCLRAAFLTTGGFRREVLVTDNGSSDATADMVRTEFSRATLIRHESNQSFTRAFNTMVARSRGRYVLLLSNDVELLPGTADLLVEAMEDSDSMGAVIPQSLKPDGTLELVCRRESTFTGLLMEWTFLGAWFKPVRERERTDSYALDVRQEVEVAQDSCMLLRREAFQQTDGFDEGFALYYTEDDLCHRLRKAGWTVVYEPAAQVRHLHRYTTRRMKPWRVRWLYVKDMLHYSAKRFGSARTNLVLRPLVYASLILDAPLRLARSLIRGR
jgi:GT2 family glycosyltransferase